MIEELLQQNKVRTITNPENALELMAGETIKTGFPINILNELIVFESGAGAIIYKDNTSFKIIGKETTDEIIEESYLQSKPTERTFRETKKLLEQRPKPKTKPQQIITPPNTVQLTNEVVNNADTTDKKS